MTEGLLRDSLTGLPNLIALADDLRELPPDGGVLALVDLRGLSLVNRDHGTAAGDRVIWQLGELLAGLAAGERARAAGEAACAPAAGTASGSPPAIRVYRAGGDEFIVHLAGVADEATNARLDAAPEAFRRRLGELGLPDAALNCAMARYPADGSSLAALLSKLHSRLRDRTVAQAGSRDAWVEALLGWFIRRLNDTVDTLRLTHAMAMTDQVSGLPNRRAAQSKLEALLEEHRERGTPFSVLFVDGDRLKAYNEELGYEAGNEMISAVGGILAASVREGDFVSRWLSGDEFLVLLPGTRSTAAYAVGERLREAVAKGSATWALPVTVSVGVSACPEHGVTADDLVRAAATASQRAKDRGRNRTEVAAVWGTGLPVPDRRH